MKPSVFLITNSKAKKDSKLGGLNWNAKKINDSWSIFFSSDQLEGINVEENCESVFFHFGLKFSYFKFSLSKESGYVFFESDKYSSQPVFYSLNLNTKELYISNSPRLISAICRPELNIETILEFLSFGIVVSGKTFYSGIDLVDGSYSLSVDFLLNKREHQFQKPEGRNGTDSNLKILKKNLTQNLEEIFDTNRIHFFRMSGGLDTRTIAILGLDYLKSNSIKIESVQSSDLKPGEDLDVELPRQFCEKEGLDFSVRQSSDLSTGYFPSPYSRSTLSGLYGGEVLGGQVYNEIPFLQADGIENAYTEVFYYQKALQSIRDAELNMGRFVYYCKLFLSSYRSAIYSSIKGSWSAPFINSNNSQSPFRNPNIIDICSQFRPDELASYAVYVSFYNKINTEHQDIPLCSGVHYFSNKMLQPKSGFDPKQVNRNSGKWNYEDWLPGARALFEKSKIYIHEEYLQRATTNSKLRLRMLNLEYWIKNFHP